MRLKSGENELASAYNSTVVITADKLAADCPVTLEIVFAEGVSADNVKITPVLCVGTTADDLVDFYK